MKIALFSNFLNHHQLPLCKALDAYTGGQFTFVATEKVPEDRKSLGYSDMNKAYPFVLTTYDSPEAEAQALQLAEDCDVMVIGSAPEKYVARRMNQDKLTFRYSERLYKKGYVYALSPRGQQIMSKHHRAYKNKPLYMLCASAFTAGDFLLNGAYVGKTYKWGYFPEAKRFANVDAIIEKKKKNSIVWVARFIDWKHPEIAVGLAEQLKRAGYAFELTMLGNGAMLEDIRAMVTQKGLSEYVHVLGAKPADQVRTYMEEAEIHIFTSDKQEGWGAVLNESMNSACAVVANKQIGSVPFMLKDGENGFVYKNVQELYNKVVFLLEHPESRKEISKRAYQTIAEEWNADVAARRLLTLCESMINQKELELWETGPCSRSNQDR